MSKKHSLFAALVATLTVTGTSLAVLPTLAQEPVPGQTPPNPASPQDPQAKPKDIYETARENPRLKTLVSAIDAAGLAEALKGKGPYTILAPVNSAFATLPPETLADLQKPENKEKLAGVLKYHVLIGKFTSADLANADEKTPLRTINGATIKLIKSPKLKFNDTVNVVTADIPAENGVIHIVDAVLLPPPATAPAPPAPDPAKPADPANR